MGLTFVREILSDALKVAESLDGTIIADTTLGNKPVEATLNRGLLNLADQLQLATALVRNEYWTGEGLMSYAV